MRNLKAFGPALVAIFAIGAIAVSAASANQFHSGSTKTTTTIAASATATFTFESGGKKVECTGMGGSGSGTSQTTTATQFAPTYSGCTVNGIGGSSAEVSMNECTYTFTIDAGANEGATHVVCNGTSQITITIKVIGISFCTLHIGKQTPSGKTKYENSGTNRINFQPSLTGIAGTRQGSAECGAATSTTGSYAGKVQNKGEITGQTTETNVQVG